MSVTLAQPMVFAGGSATTQAFTLGSPPTPGNLILAGMSGNDNGSVPASMRALFADSTPSNSALYAAYRRVQPGDPAGPYTFTGFSTGWDGGGFICELAGAGIPSVFAEGNSNWTLTSPNTTQAANNTLTTLAGSLIIELYVVYTAANNYAQGADTINQSFVIVSHGALATTATNRQYQVIATRSDASGSTANPAAVMPNVGTGTSPQSQMGIVIPPGNSGGNGSVASCYGNIFAGFPNFPRAL